MDGADVRMGQLKDVGLGASWAGQSGPMGLFPLGKGQSQFS